MHRESFEEVSRRIILACCGSEVAGASLERAIECLNEVFQYVQERDKFDKLPITAFACHGAEHVLSMLRLLESCLSAWRLRSNSALTRVDAAVLLISAVVLHDIGMIVGPIDETHRLLELRLEQTHRIGHDFRSRVFIEEHVALGSAWKVYWEKSGLPLSSPKASSAMELLARIVQSHGDGEPWLHPDKLNIYQYATRVDILKNFNDEFGDEGATEILEVVIAASASLCLLDLAEIGPHRLPLPLADWKKIDRPRLENFPTTIVHYLSHQLTKVRPSSSNGKLGQPDKWIELVVSTDAVGEQITPMRRSILKVGPIADALIYGNRRELTQAISNHVFESFSGFRLVSGPKRSSEVRLIEQLVSEWVDETSENLFPWRHQVLWRTGEPGSHDLDYAVLEPTLWRQLTSHVFKRSPHSIRYPYGTEQILQLRAWGIPVQWACELERVQPRSQIAGRGMVATAPDGIQPTQPALLSLLGAIKAAEDLALTGNRPGRVVFTNWTFFKQDIELFSSSIGEVFDGIFIFDLGSPDSTRTPQLGDIREVLSRVGALKNVQLVFWGSDVRKSLEGLGDVVLLMSVRLISETDGRAVPTGKIVGSADNKDIDFGASSLLRGSGSDTSETEPVESLLRLLRSSELEAQLVADVDTMLKSSPDTGATVGSPIYAVGIVTLISLLSYRNSVQAEPPLNLIRQSYVELNNIFSLGGVPTFDAGMSFLKSRGFVVIDGKGEVSLTCDFVTIRERLVHLEPRKVRLTQVAVFLYCVKCWDGFDFRDAGTEVGRIGPGLLAPVLSDILLSGRDLAQICYLGMWVAEFVGRLGAEDVSACDEFIAVINGFGLGLCHSDGTGFLASQMIYHVVRNSEQFLRNFSVPYSLGECATFGILEALLSYTGQNIEATVIEEKLKNLLVGSMEAISANIDSGFGAMIFDALVKYKFAGGVSAQSVRIDADETSGMQSVLIEQFEKLGVPAFSFLVNDVDFAVSVFLFHLGKVYKRNDAEETDLVSEWKGARRTFLRVVDFVPPQLRRPSSRSMVI